jgi:hypothetical protein
VAPKVKEFYDQYKDELKLGMYAVGTQTEDKRQAWLDFIKEKQLNWINVCDPEQKTAYKYLYDIYSTPVIYILDKDKKIIAKRLEIDVVGDFIRRHKKFNP